MILLVDNYDSFTYNLAHQFNKSEVVILRNDDPALLETAKKADGIVLSPGPGTPEQAGMLKKVIQEFYQTKPILGICLGHQAIGEVFGGNVVKAPLIMHGKQSTIRYEETGLFKGLTGEISVMRYHSLVIDPLNFPKELVVLAETDDCIMAVKHQDYLVYGLQFHPESIGTPVGQQLIDRFVEIVEGT